MSQKTNKNRRSSLKVLGTVSLSTALMPSVWRTPLVNAVILPAHAQTSFGIDCSGVETEPVDQPISITVTATEIRGPIIVARTDNTFAGSVTNNVGQCGDSSARTELVELSGTIDSDTNSITGAFNVSQFCGDALACEQLTNFSVSQVMPVDDDDLGDYQGRVIGTLRCCVDFL